MFLSVLQALHDPVDEQGRLRTSQENLLHMVSLGTLQYNSEDKPFRHPTFYDISVSFPIHCSNSAQVLLRKPQLHIFAATQQLERVMLSLHT